MSDTYDVWRAVYDCPKCGATISDRGNPPAFRGDEDDLDAWCPGCGWNAFDDEGNDDG